MKHIPPLAPAVFWATGEQGKAIIDAFLAETRKKMGFLPELYAFILLENHDSGHISLTFRSGNSLETHILPAESMDTELQTWVRRAYMSVLNHRVLEMMRQREITVDDQSVETFWIGNFTAPADRDLAYRLGPFIHSYFQQQRLSGDRYLVALLEPFGLAVALPANLYDTLSDIYHAPHDTLPFNNVFAISEKSAAGVALSHTDDVAIYCGKLIYHLTIGPMVEDSRNYLKYFQGGSRRNFFGFGYHANVFDPEVLIKKEAQKVFSHLKERLLSGEQQKHDGIATINAVSDAPDVAWMNALVAETAGLAPVEESPAENLPARSQSETVQPLPDDRPEPETEPLATTATTETAVEPAPQPLPESAGFFQKLDALALKILKTHFPVSDTFQAWQHGLETIIKTITTVQMEKVASKHEQLRRHYARLWVKRRFEVPGREFTTTTVETSKPNVLMIILMALVFLSGAGVYYFTEAILYGAVPPLLSLGFIPFLSQKEQHTQNHEREVPSDIEKVVEAVYGEKNLWRKINIKTEQALENYNLRLNRLADLEMLLKKDAVRFEEPEIAAVNPMQSSVLRESDYDTLTGAFQDEIQQTFHERLTWDFVFNLQDLIREKQLVALYSICVDAVSFLRKYNLQSILRIMADVDNATYRKDLPRLKSIMSYFIKRSRPQIAFGDTEIGASKIFIGFNREKNRELNEWVQNLFSEKDKVDFFYLDNENMLEFFQLGWLDLARIQLPAPVVAGKENDP